MSEYPHDPVETLPLAGGYTLHRFGKNPVFYLFLDGCPVKSSSDANVAMIDGGNHDAIRHFAMVMQGRAEARNGPEVTFGIYPPGHAEKFTLDGFIRPVTVQSKYIPGRTIPGRDEFVCPNCGRVTFAPKHGELGTCAECRLIWMAQGNALYIWREYEQDSK